MPPSRRGWFQRQLKSNENARRDLWQIPKESVMQRQPSRSEFKWADVPNVAPSNGIFSLYIFVNNSGCSEKEQPFCGIINIK